MSIGSPEFFLALGVLVLLAAVIGTICARLFVAASRDG